MPVNEYSFVTVWKIEAPLKTVWDAICDIEDLPNWWKAVVSIKVLDRGDSDGINFLTELSLERSITLSTVLNIKNYGGRLSQIN